MKLPSCTIGKSNRFGALGSGDEEEHGSDSNVRHGSLNSQIWRRRVSARDAGAVDGSCSSPSHIIDCRRFQHKGPITASQEMNRLKGAGQPSLNISTVITSISLLLSEPNPDDGPMCEANYTILTK